MSSLITVGAGRGRNAVTRPRRQTVGPRYSVLAAVNGTVLRLAPTRIRRTDPRRLARLAEPAARET